jgi:hypothetical protein
MVLSKRLSAAKRVIDEAKPTQTLWIFLLWSITLLALPKKQERGYGAPKRILVLRI